MNDNRSTSKGVVHRRVSTVAGPTNFRSASMSEMQSVVADSVNSVPAMIRAEIESFVCVFSRDEAVVLGLSRWY